jgi:hypothetical protein
MRPEIFKLIFSPDEKTKNYEREKIEEWLTQMHHLAVFSVNYSYRMKTKSIFESGLHPVPRFFDLFILDDPSFI